METFVSCVGEIVLATFFGDQVKDLQVDGVKA